MASLLRKLAEVVVEGEGICREGFVDDDDEFKVLRKCEGWECVSKWQLGILLWKTILRANYSRNYLLILGFPNHR